MDIVIDTSALIAVIVAEPERDAIVDATSGHTLIGPGSIPWEVGNAFSAMLKQRRIGISDAQRGLEILGSIPMRYVNVDLANALSMAAVGPPEEEVGEALRLALGEPCAEVLPSRSVSPSVSPSRV